MMETKSTTSKTVSTYSSKISQVCKVQKEQYSDVLGLISLNFGEPKLGDEGEKVWAKENKGEKLKINLSGEVVKVNFKTKNKNSPTGKLVNGLVSHITEMG